MLIATTKIKNFVDCFRPHHRIERSLEQTKAGLRFKSPKTKHGRRNISLPPSTIAELRSHLLRQQERRLALGMGRAKSDDLIFARWDGKARSPHWLTCHADAQDRGRDRALFEAYPCLAMNRRRHGRLDHLAPAWPWLADDHAVNIRSHVPQHG
jgi:hypothetical protein